MDVVYVFLIATTVYSRLCVHISWCKNDTCYHVLPYLQLVFPLCDKLSWFTAGRWSTCQIQFGFHNTQINVLSVCSVLTVKKYGSDFPWLRGRAVRVFHTSALIGWLFWWQIPLRGDPVWIYAKISCGKKGIMFDVNHPAAMAADRLLLLCLRICLQSLMWM